MNITLSADAELIKKSRAYARAHNTSLNQLVRDYLNQLAGGHGVESLAREFAELAKSMPGRSDPEFRFSRSEIYDRHQQR